MSQNKKYTILFKETTISTTSLDALLLFKSSKFDMQVLHNNNSMVGLGLIKIIFYKDIDWCKFIKVLHWFHLI